MSEATETPREAPVPTEPPADARGGVGESKPSEDGAKAPSAPKQRPRFRLMDALTVLLLSLAVAGSLAAAGPALLRVAGVGSPPNLVGSIGAGRLAPAEHPPVPRTFFAPPDEDEDEPRVTELERMYPDGMWPGRNGRDPKPSARGRDPSGGDAHGKIPALGKTTRLGLTQKPLTLFDSPGENGDVLGAVKAGELVMIVREVGDWALVVYEGADDVLMGWLKKSGIAIR